MQLRSVAVAAFGVNGLDVPSVTPPTCVCHIRLQIPQYCQYLQHLGAYATERQTLSERYPPATAAVCPDEPAIANAKSCC